MTILPESMFKVKVLYKDLRKPEIQDLWKINLGLGDTQNFPDIYLNAFSAFEIQSR